MPSNARRYKRFHTDFTCKAVSYSAFRYVISAKNALTLFLNEGKKREIRIIAETIGNRVTDLLRVSIGTYTLGNLPTGKMIFFCA